MKDNLVYIGLLVLLGFVVWQRIGARLGTKPISAEELKNRLAQRDSIMVVDVREASEYATGHIPGARLIPLSTFPGGAKGLPKDVTIVLVCRSGNRSARAYKMLEQQGYSNLLNMTGGMLAWRGPVKR